MGGLGGKGDERSSESGFSDDLFVFVGFVGEAHATGCVVVVWGESRRDICLPSFLRRRESTFEFRQLFLNICFLGFPMDSRLRGNDGCWR